MASLINPTNIDITYPIAGQDNDTQGFRTNFQNIQNNFLTAASEITTLQSNTSAIVANVTILQTGGLTTANSLTANTITLTSVIQFANLTTTQINSIATPARGMTAYNYSTGNIQVYNGSKWANVTLS